MLDSTKSELDSLMNRFNEDLGGLRAKREEEKASRETFIKDFERLKHEVIWPVIVEVGNQLNTYGHDYHVTEEESYTDATARFQPACITLNIYPATLDRSQYLPESTPYISFVSDNYARKIRVMVSTMMPEESGVVGCHGEYEVGQITREFVENEIVAVLKNTLIFHKES